jgi:hypothetical protein
MPRTKFLLSCLLAVAACGTTGGDDPPFVCEDFTAGVSTLSGAPTVGNVDGERCKARFHNPTGVAIGPDGKIYVADFDNDEVRAVATDGTTETVIKQTGFRKPFGVLFVGSKLYVSTDNAPGGAHGAKTGTIWSVDIGGRKATPMLANMGRARGMAALKDGRIAIADYQSHVIMLWSPGSPAAVDLAGQRGVKGAADGVGAGATFAQPYSIVQRADGSLLVTDWENNKLRIVTLDGRVTTVAGSTQGFADGPMGGAKFAHPQAMVQTSSGDIFLTDLENLRIRKIDAALTTVTTVAGDGKAGPADNDDPLAAEFYGLEGITVTSDGAMVYFSDGSRGNDAIHHNSIKQLSL